MKISLSWLKDYIDINLDPVQIGKILTMAGLEVDAIEAASLGCKDVIVCKVLEVKKHPQADKLCIATVTDGKETFQIVCGAANCREGMKTAFAREGATVLSEDGKTFKIKKSKIRGVESPGMLCAPVEIGLKDTTDGIIEFSAHIQEGIDVGELYADTIFEISLTPNLGHCASLIGVARELSAITELPVHYPKIQLQEGFLKPSFKAAVEILNPEGCPRYACRVIEGVSVGPSPDWLKKRLEASGLRSINTVVDVTNYVMLELGHPLHAFDADKVEGKKIFVKNAHAKELFVTLDGKERILEDQDILICDQNKPLALAGIMGGLNSEVGFQTKNLIIEAAFFTPAYIRRTSKRLGLISDASKHFERGTDPNVLIQALDRAAGLIQELSGGQISPGAMDVSTKEFPRKRIRCRLSRVNKILGTQLGVSEVENIFNRLEFKFLWDGQKAFNVDVPTYRNDLQEEIDLIEEVARIYGYDNIKQSSNYFHASKVPHAPIFIFEREIRSRLLCEGLQEFLTCDLIGPSLINVVQETDMPEKAWVKVLNPTSIEQSILRTSLLPGLLNVVKYNWDHQNREIGGFEIGRIHFKAAEKYTEQSVAGIVLSGKSRPQHWDVKPREYDFFDLKGIVENLLAELKVPKVTFKDLHLSSLHPGKQTSIFSDSLEIGSMGEVHPAVLRRLDIPQRILFAEINLHDLYNVKGSVNRMFPIPMYPGSERDWTITLEEKIPIDEVFKAIQASSSDLLESFFLLDVYKSDKLGAGIRNVTFRFAYRDWEKTIAQETVDAEHARIIAYVLKSLKI